MSRSQQLAALTRPRVLALALALAALVAGLLSLAVPAARSADARPAAAAGTPKLKLIAAQKTIEVAKYGNSHIPNGTYYIEIIANPEHLLHEVSTANDTSLRRVILSGTPGHRTVLVPAYHGLDREH